MEEGRNLARTGMEIKTVVTKEIADVVCAAVKRAGKAAMHFYRTDGLKIVHKEDASPVTQADIAANTVLLEELAVFGFPVLSEETADTINRREQSRVWIVDPIDGTRDFINQTGEFCVMVGLSEFGRATFGVVYIPTTDTLYYGGVELGAWMMQGDTILPVQVSMCDDTNSATMVTSRFHTLPVYAEVATALHVKQQIHIGSNGLKCTLVATGHADMFLTVTSKLGEWDMCAPHSIVEAAGGRVSGIDGTTLTYNKIDPHMPQGVVVTNGILHDEVLTYLDTHSIFPQ